MTQVASTKLNADFDPLATALRTLEIEQNGILALKAALEGDLAAPFDSAVNTILDATIAKQGRLIVTGMGKSGHVGQKLAATFASTGTPAFFVHPSEASHGDLGMITRDDVVMALSWSGETTELASILNYTTRFKVPLIAITSKSDSALARAATTVLALPRVAEACPHGLAPTTSTLMQLAIGDALAVALLEASGFTASDFKTFHPGGQLGANLKYVRDIMHGTNALPLAPEDTPMADAIVMITEKSFGCLGVTDSDGALVGIVTDGDLRRKMSPELLTRTVGEVMTAGPKTVQGDDLATAALEILNAKSITALFVVEGRKPVGIVHIHDLLRIGVA